MQRVVTMSIVYIMYTMCIHVSYIADNVYSVYDAYAAVRLIVEQNAFVIPIVHVSAKVWGVQGYVLKTVLGLLHQSLQLIGQPHLLHTGYA